MLSQIYALALMLSAVFITYIASRRFNLPVIVLEVLAGIILGKSVLNIVSYDMWLDFLADFGLMYLMFLAGLEMGVKEFRKGSVLLALGSLITPFLLGALLGLLLDVPPLLLGTLLSTTSIGVVLPVLKDLNHDNDFKRLTLESAFLVDTFSMFLLTLSLEVSRGTTLTLLAFSLVFALTLFILPVTLRSLNVSEKMQRWSSEKEHFDYEVRLCFALIVFLAVVFEILGFHMVLGSFLAGLIVSELTVKGGALEGRLSDFGYGFFIPLFFIAVGLTVNVRALIRPEWLSMLLLLLAMGVGGKLLGVVVIGKILGLSTNTGLAMGILHSARLSLILAGAKIGLELGLLTEEVYSTTVVFAITTVLLCPAIARKFMRKAEDDVKRSVKV
ncbi:cation:proton antiporter [Candidatus Bathyarchaeota archaeon]|nr:cation:proton antiporter [Candidatus Bathyarchaeota archaeon]RJS74935.1 MAG: cation:proton antiporter [Candidatus Bathyarchaeota archaeon]